MSTGILVALLGTSAVVHAVAPEVYEPIVPDWVPGTPGKVVAVSGVAEGVVAAGLLHPSTRRLAGWAAAVLFVAILPANIYMARLMRTPRARLLAWARVPLQLPLIVWAVNIGRRRG